MSCKGIGQEVEISVGFRPQADFATANAANEILWNLPTINRIPAVIRAATSDDAAFTGKTHEWATQRYKEAYVMDSFSLDMVAAAEMLAWATVFGLGKSVKSGTDPDLTYTVTPMARAADGCELMPFTLVQKMRGGTLLDEALLGCVLDGFSLSVQSGPERTNSALSLRMMGTGNFTSPSSIVSGTAPTLVDLLSATLALSANSVDYVAATRINSLEFDWSNGALMRYYPGSGTKDSYAVAGTAQYTPARRGSLRMNVDFVGVAAEITKVRAQTEGTAVFSLTSSASRSWACTLQRIHFADYNFEEDERGINVTVDVPLLYHSSNGLMSIVGKCGIDNIGVAA